MRSPCSSAVCVPIGSSNQEECQKVFLRLLFIAFLLMQDVPVDDASPRLAVTHRAALGHIPDSVSRPPTLHGGTPRAVPPPTSESLDGWGQGDSPQLHQGDWRLRPLRHLLPTRFPPRWPGVPDSRARCSPIKRPGEAQNVTAPENFFRAVVNGCQSSLMRCAWPNSDVPSSSAPTGPYLSMPTE
jgi:hypothetical protein